MKTCIITFQSANNFGAVLQAYALQRYLNDHFSHTSILNYHNSIIDKSYSIPHINDFINNPKNAIFRSAQTIIFHSKNRKINSFREEFLPLTTRYDKKNISQAANEADIFITGSDQVWNHLIINNDSTYFLDFAEGKLCCSYAASVGVSEIPESLVGFYRSNLKRFSYISVREEQGKGLIEGLCGREVYTLVDPTLLLQRKEWENLCIFPSNKKKRYILVYKITKADSLLQFARRLSQITGLDIIYIPNDLKSGSIGRLKLDVGPREWLGYIHNAEYVVTNSFHGTVFSIMFGIKFFSEVSERVNPSTSRLLSLLKKFDLETRVTSSFNDSILTQEIDLIKINEVLNRERNKVKMFFSTIYGEGAKFETNQ